jgi:hypothetical protein
VDGRDKPGHDELTISVLPRPHIAKQKSRDFPLLDFLAAFGDAVAAVVAVDVQRLVYIVRFAPDSGLKPVIVACSKCASFGQSLPYS